MSKSLETVETQKSSANRKLCYSLPKNKPKYVLKSKENIFKPKCSRELKKKLKKYKLRKDGIEDPDILDVSEILVTSLRIKSPSNPDKINCNNNLIELEELNQGNYLIRMVRKKKICTEIESLVTIINDSNEESQMKISLEETSDKKHADAFQLLMEARNKSLGSNSPGKEKVGEQELRDIAQRKEIKAKRNLTLQKMAVSKGSLKNKEIEGLRDKCIKKKLVKRAERLKNMLTKSDPKCNQKPHNASSKESQSNDRSDLKIKAENKKSLQLCDIFNEKVEIIGHGKEPQIITTEDIEFLEKLSPSIKKKENMLSYFQKIQKDNSEQPEDNTSVIKVKFNSKLKKKKSKLADKPHTTLESVENNVVKNLDESHINGCKRIKRKRNLNVEKIISPPLPNPSNIEFRPKRTVKKPLKYTEDVQMFSSDEELHIFTPKKKKMIEKPIKTKIFGTTQLITNKIDCKYERNNASDTALESPKKDEGKNKFKKKTFSNQTKCANNPSSKSLKHSNDNKAAKLAPIFVAKIQLSPAIIEAKQKFLQSGVPEKLKKKMQRPINEITIDMFPSVIHIQQCKPDTSLHQEMDWFTGSHTEVHNIQDDESYFTHNKHSFKSLLKLDEVCKSRVLFSKLDPEQVLKIIKSAYPKFPVYRTYHLLNGKRKGEFKDCNYPNLDNSIEIISGQSIDLSNENPDQLNWCDKYKPTSSKQIIGNSECIKELKKWLETWTENIFKANQLAWDSSDFSDFYNSDMDSRDATRNTNNVLILTGQTGSGKTSSVYAVASELAIKVIEVNASSKRTGKIMLQELQEATQSHKVDRGKSSTDTTQKQHEESPTAMKKFGRPKKIHNGKLKFGADTKLKQPSLKSSEKSQIQIIASQESVRTGMSLILVDDADIIFEQDDGFCSAIAQLIQSSKRPVILVSSSLSCSHLQRFLQYGKVIHMRPVLSRTFGTWLDIMCLADVGNCCTGLGAKVLDFYRGDIRKTINCLQFYMNSNKHISMGEEITLSQFKHNINDEDSSMSWLDSESVETPISNDYESDTGKLLHVLHVGNPLDVFNIWWEIPRLYKDCNKQQITAAQPDEGNSKNSCHNTELDATERLDKIAHVLDTISAIDCFNYINPDKVTNITTRPWHGLESASLFEIENFECYNKSSLITREIADELINNTISKAQRYFKCENSLNLSTPNMSVQRTRDKIVSRHNTLSSYMHSSAVLDRRATALDYWPACRAICRIEKNRTHSNMRRKNRFCHYLKSLDMLGKNDFFERLADSLT